MPEEIKKYIISEEIDLIDEIYENIEAVKTVAELLMHDNEGGYHLHKSAAGVIYSHGVAARKAFDKLRELNKPKKSNISCVS